MLWNLMSLHQTCILNKNFNKIYNSYLQEPPRGLRDFILSYSSNYEADNGSNPKFQRIRLKNINMQRYDKPRNI